MIRLWWDGGNPGRWVQDREDLCAPHRGARSLGGIRFFESGFLDRARKDDTATTRRWSLSRLPERLR